MNYKELAEQALDYIVEQRRWCHQNPELSLEEVQTTELHCMDMHCRKRKVISI